MEKWVLFLERGDEKSAAALAFFYVVDQTIHSTLTRRIGCSVADFLRFFVADDSTALEEGKETLGAHRLR